MKAAGMTLLLALVIAPVAAQAQKYTFDVPEKLVNIQFESQMDIEDILGTSNSVTGDLELKGRDKGTFRFAVPVKSLKTGIDLRDDHLRSAHWLDAEKFPDVVFEGQDIKPLGGNRYRVTGIFTLHGEGKERSFDVKAQEIDGARAKKLGLSDTVDFKWLRVRGSFAIKLSDHGVKIPGMAAAKVNDEWTVKVSLFARENR